MGLCPRYLCGGTVQATNFVMVETIWQWLRKFQGRCVRSSPSTAAQAVHWQIFGWTKTASLMAGQHHVARKRHTRSLWSPGLRGYSATLSGPSIGPVCLLACKSHLHGMANNMLSTEGTQKGQCHNQDVTYHLWQIFSSYDTNLSCPTPYTLLIANHTEHLLISPMQIPLPRGEFHHFGGKCGTIAFLLTKLLASQHHRSGVRFSGGYARAKGLSHSLHLWLVLL